MKLHLRESKTLFLWKTGKFNCVTVNQNLIVEVIKLSARYLKLFGDVSFQSFYNLSYFGIAKIV